MTQKLKMVNVAPIPKIHASCFLQRGSANFSLYLPLVRGMDTDVRLSTQPIVSLLNPRVLAVSSNFRLVPFNIPLCSTRFSNAARPWAIY